MKDCKYGRKSVQGKEYVRCELDNSLKRKDKGCRNCNKYEKSLRKKLSERLFGR